MDCVVNKVFHQLPLLSNLCEIGRNGREIHRQTDVESCKRFSNILKKKNSKHNFQHFLIIYINTETDLLWSGAVDVDIRVLSTLQETLELKVKSVRL